MTRLLKEIALSDMRVVFPPTARGNEREVCIRCGYLVFFSLIVRRAVGVQHLLVRSGSWQKTGQIGKDK